MRSQCWPASIPSILILAPAVLAQTTTPHSTPTTTTPVLASGSASFFAPSLVPSNATPHSNDSAPTGNNDHHLNKTGVVQYYFVFLALLLCCLGLAIFFLCRRRARRRTRQSGGRQSALQRDLSGPGGWYGGLPRAPTRAYRRPGQWRDAELSREEGLNEHGEAPPAYVPKRHSQEQRRAGEAIPMDTLSRADDVGAKPPDYSEASTREVDPQSRSSVASASSSRNPEHSTNP